MKTIELTQGKVALVDDDDFEYLNQYKWYAVKKPNTYYATRKEKNKEIRMHREILKIKNPKKPIDHKDHNGLNNCRNNIRACNTFENTRNKQSAKNSTSKYLGVSLRCFKRKYISKTTGIEKNYKSYSWVSQLNIPNKPKHLGYFKTELEAAIIYNIAARKYYGKFANPNKF